VSHTQSTASVPGKVKCIPSPHSNNIPAHGNIDQGSSHSVPSHRQQRKEVRSFIDEVVPASDDEADAFHESLPSPNPQQLQQLSINSQLQHVSTKPRSKIASDETVHICDDVGTVDDFDPLFDVSEDQLSNLPSHRARAANPLVKMVENPVLSAMDGAISVKTRLAGRDFIISPTPEKSRKPGPGRSSSGFIKNSLLTFQKGSLKTVKGRYKKQTEKPGIEMEVIGDGRNPEPGGELDHSEGPNLFNNPTVQVAPTADELLGLAGLDAQNAENLSDFEEDALSEVQVPEPDSQPLPLSPAPQPDPTELARQRRYVVDIPFFNIS
jgi:hypothetical protein